MMNYYSMMESPLTTTSSFDDFADMDLNLLLSFDHEDEKALFYELEEGCDNDFPFTTSMNEIIEFDVFDEVSLVSASTSNELPLQLTSIPVKVESTKKRCNKR